MQIAATYDFFRDFGGGDELVLRGQVFDPPATASMSREEHADSLIRQGAAVPVKDWPKHDAKTGAKHQATMAMLAAMPAAKRRR